MLKQHFQSEWTLRKISIAKVYRSGDIILINFPFTNLTGSKVRPALVIVEKKAEDIKYIKRFAFLVITV